MIERAIAVPSTEAYVRAKAAEADTVEANVAGKPFRQNCSPNFSSEETLRGEYALADYIVTAQYWLCARRERLTIFENSSVRSSCFSPDAPELFGLSALRASSLYAPSEPNRTLTQLSFVSVLVFEFCSLCLLDSYAPFSWVVFIKNGPVKHAPDIDAK